jgi:hypothetical protein
MHSIKMVLLCFLLLSIVLVAGSSFPVQAATFNFGHANIGDSNAATFSGVYISNFTSLLNIGDITQISAYLATGGTFAKAVIYADYNGRPYTLLAESAQIRINGTSGEWVNFNISYRGTPNTVYWLGVVFQNAGTYYYSSGVEEHAIYFAPLSDMLNPFPTGNYTKGTEMSIIAIYTPTDVPDTNQSSWLQTGLLWTAITGLIIAAVIAFLIVVRTKKK